jgi:Family of unknown function (DUF6308)
MCTVDCETQLEIVRDWFSDDHLECATALVQEYVINFRGRRFDCLAAKTAPNRIEPNDLAAVRSLSVGFPHDFVACLSNQATKARIKKTLEDIPTGKRLEELSCDEFELFLGEGSVAWDAWHELVLALKKSRARAPYVVASKLLAAKRLTLIPLEDSLVRRVLQTPRRNIWKVIHCLVRDQQLYNALVSIREVVAVDDPLTLHRILDIVAWRKAQGHCCQLDADHPARLT